MMLQTNLEFFEKLFFLLLPAAYQLLNLSLLVGFFLYHDSSATIRNVYFIFCIAQYYDYR